MATPEEFYLVKNIRLAWLSFGPYSGGGPCSGEALLRDFTVHTNIWLVKHVQSNHLKAWRHAHFQTFTKNHPRSYTKVPDFPQNGPVSCIGHKQLKETD